MPFSRQNPNGSQDLFFLAGIFLFKFFGYETIETHALTFLSYIILASANMFWNYQIMQGNWMELKAKISYLFMLVFILKIIDQLPCLQTFSRKYNSGT